jgi:hypothetical protein
VFEYLIISIRKDNKQLRNLPCILSVCVIRPNDTLFTLIETRIDRNIRTMIKITIIMTKHRRIVKHEMKFSLYPISDSLTFHFDAVLIA